jgi:hypothetical protein
MKFALPIFLLALSFFAHAEQLESRINSIDVAAKKGVSHLIKLENGRVIFVNHNDKETLDSFRQSLSEQSLLNVEVDEKSNFISAESIDDKSVPVSKEVAPALRVSYEPTVVSSAEASSIFRRMRRDYQNQSQCYNRAHIWTYEEFKYSGLRSLKLFLFFTNRYIRNYRYKWWFHVSPMVSSSSGELVLDRRYTSGPRLKDTWTKNFIYSGRKCPVVNNYYDYRNHQEEQDCYLIPTSMYFWQPWNIQSRDNGNGSPTQYYQSNINHAYWEAF